MALLNREALLKKETLKIQKVDLGNEEFVFVREMTGREKGVFEQSLTKKIYDSKGKLDHVEQDLSDARAKLAVCALCDEEGNLLLKPSDYEALSMGMSAFKLEKIAEAATELNQVTEAVKEEAVKNSGEGPAEGSPSV